MTIPDDSLEAAKQIVSEGEKQGVKLRLIGGLAFKVACPSASDDKHRRQYKDIDVIGKAGSAGKIDRLMKSLGYSPRDAFNKLNLGRRLLYYNGKMRVDVFVGEFEMCHRFNFGDDIENGGLTLPITDLVMTKLQVMEHTEKEKLDLLAAFMDYDVTVDDGGINGQKIAAICSKDWGVWKTFSLNLEWLSVYAGDPSKERIRRLEGMIDRRQKSFGWKLRAKLGTWAKWYEEPVAA